MKLVSVIIPTYSRPKNLLRALESVFNQTYPNIEVIIVDDNGENTPYQLETQQLLSSYISERKIDYIKHSVNCNGSAARNTGLKYSNGYYVNFLDDDDIMMPQKIAEQVEFLEKTNDIVGACYCNSKIIGRYRSFNTHNTKSGVLTGDLLSGDVEFNTSTILFRRDALLKINGFDESFQRHQDWELCVRFFREFEMGLVKDCLLTKVNTENIIMKYPLKAIEFKEKFLQTFKGDISRLNNPGKIIGRQYEMLALSLLMGGYKRIGLKYIILAGRNTLPSLYVVFKYIYYLIKM